MILGGTFQCLITTNNTNNKEWAPRYVAEVENRPIANHGRS